MIQVFPAIIRYFVMVLGNTMNSHKTFIGHLTESQKLQKVYSENDCDVIIAFVPIVSRAGTDIAAAMSKIPQEKPVVLVVLHHTFDKNYQAPDSRRSVNKDNMFVVDCLFFEDQGLLRCPHNDAAIRAVKDLLIRDVIRTSKTDHRWIRILTGVLSGATGGAAGVFLRSALGDAASGVLLGVTCGVLGGVLGGAAGGVLRVVLGGAAGGVLHSVLGGAIGGVVGGVAGGSAGVVLPGVAGGVVGFCAGLDTL